MSLDEDTYVIIVGDDDFEIPDSLKDVVMDGEFTELNEEEADNNDINLMEEETQNENFFFVDQDIEVQEEEVDDNDEEYVPKADEMSSDDDEISDEECGKSKKKYSYVLELRQAYPELRKDDKMMVNILARIMNALKPPPLPQDYFLMNGIMSECVKCGRLSNGIPEAARHYQEYHGERYLICFACGDDFRSPSSLYQHEKKCTAPDIGLVLKARSRHMAKKARSRSYVEDGQPNQYQQ